MTLKSMTGYARVNGQHELCTWSWELKSVNAKGLDVRCRLAHGFEALDAIVRKRTSKIMKRGNVSVGLSVDWQQSAGGFQINNDILDLVISTLPEIEARLGNAGPTSVADILGLRGVIESADQEITEAQKEVLSELILADFDQTIEALDEMRKDEGARLSLVLTEQLDEIAKLTGQAKQNAATQPTAIRDRMQVQIQEILNNNIELSEDRMAQEIALLVTKADIREEIDRLDSHEQAARDYLNNSGSVGRKLDFLCQEFNREANTLCSKSTDVELTKTGLDLKAFIERFREQIQNIE